VRILISAGEASGDLYASRVVEALKRRFPDAVFFGCAGPRMQAAGVRPVVDQRSLAVVGIVEVLAHVPRIYREFRKLIRAAEREKPDLAVLTDSPDFHLRVAKKLAARGIPVIYLIAPQAWAWRSGRTRLMSRVVQHLLCIFPFEEPFFRERGIPATFIGHPLARIVKPSMSRTAFCARFGVDERDRVVVLLPGSRHGEAARHMPYLIEAIRLITRRLGETGGARKLRYVLALPAGFTKGLQNAERFSERARAASIQVIEGLTWDCLAQAEVALAASGTVTIEAALSGTPMVTFYRVNALTWMLGRWMVRAPFLSMVNLVAGRRVAAELIQKDMTAEAIAEEALRLLEDETARAAMRGELLEVAAKLASPHDPMETAADCIEKVLARGKTAGIGIRSGTGKSMWEGKA
jgi:lipid-A-disaccharide synthase